MNTYSKTETEKLVKDEIKKFISSELDKEIGRLLKSSSSNTRGESIEIAKMAISKLAEFLWIKKAIWKGDMR